MGVALYTSAAPGYFPSVDGFVDGGIFAYHPGAAALAWVLAGRTPAEQNISLNQLCLLSLGTGSVHHALPGMRHDWSIVRWIPFLSRLVREGNVGLVEHQCRMLLQERYHRLSPRLGQPIAPDVWEQCHRLQDIGKDINIDATVAWLRLVWQSERAPA